MTSLRTEGRSFAIGSYIYLILCGSYALHLILCVTASQTLVIPRGYWLYITPNIHCAVNTVGESETELATADDVMPGELPPLLDAAISLPTSLFELMMSSHTSSSLVFAHYNESTLFPVDGGKNMNSSAPRQTVIGTDILAATVVGETFTDLEEDMKVAVIFQPKIPDEKV